MMSIESIRSEFASKLKRQDFVINKDGSKVLEIVGAQFIASDDHIFGKPNHQYIQHELEWYQSQSLNVNDIPGKTPAIWEMVSSDKGEINSNYGYLIFSDKFYNQYDRALAELMANGDSRRACIVYNRPSIWAEYNENGKSDFICTNAVTYYVRGNQLHCCVQMRSNDVIFGYRNDYAWQKYILDRMVDDLNDKNFDHVEPGNIYWQVQNLHIYEKHFHLVD